MLPIPSFTIPQSFLFHIFPVSPCSWLLNFGQRHISWAAVTRQLYTLVYVPFFSLTDTMATLSSSYLCVPYKAPAHSVLHPDFAATFPSHSLKPRISSVGTMCVFKQPSSSLWRALYHIPVFSTRSDSVNLCRVVPSNHQWRVDCGRLTHREANTWSR
jgi:hypothetical protein